MEIVYPTWNIRISIGQSCDKIPESDPIRALIFAGWAERIRTDVGLNPDRHRFPTHIFSARTSPVLRSWTDVGPTFVQVVWANTGSNTGQLWLIEKMLHVIGPRADYVESLTDTCSWGSKLNDAGPIIGFLGRWYLPVKSDKIAQVQTMQKMKEAKKDAKKELTNFMHFRIRNRIRHNLQHKQRR